jgi:hypothetical protein
MRGRVIACVQAGALFKPGGRDFAPVRTKAGRGRTAAVRQRQKLNAKGRSRRVGKA